MNATDALGGRPLAIVWKCSSAWVRRSATTRATASGPNPGSAARTAGGAWCSEMPPGSTPRSSAHGAAAMPRTRPISRRSKKGRLAGGASPRASYQPRSAPSSRGRSSASPQSASAAAIESAGPAETPALRSTRATSGSGAVFTSRVAPVARAVTVQPAAADAAAGARTESSPVQASTAARCVSPVRTASASAARLWRCARQPRASHSASTSAVRLRARAIASFAAAAIARPSTPTPRQIHSTASSA
jgi:hypothetical protein